MTELRFDAVTVQYGHGRRAMRAVDRVDLTVPPGQVVGLVGESGCGKSTLARAAVGLTPVTAGRVLIDGAPPPRRTRTGQARPLQLVFQDPYSSLDPRMGIGQSLAEALPRGAVPGRNGRRAEIRRLLRLVDLEPDCADALPAELSGGQRQRVALARALAGRPDVLIADEITSALDVSVQGSVLNLVRELQQRLRLSMLFISHNLAVVRYVSDVIAVMYLGRIVECGPATDVLADPQHPYTRELLAAAPSDARAVRRPDLPESEAHPLVDAEPPDPHQPPSGCHFHARCPIGPLVLSGRERCLDIDPFGEAAQRRHGSACHFAEVLSP
jgi:peptide/nickel transport system ATP-binding protein